MTSGSKTHRVVVGIDFGTSRSGYAYAFIDDKKIVVNTIWPDQPVPYPKTSTHILYSPDRKVAGWGNEARTKLAQLRKANRYTGYSYFNEFKLQLRNAADKQEGNPLISASSGASFRLLDVIADYLRLLKGCALSEIRAATSNNIVDNEILWCLSIPAIWTDSEKHMMRVAARRAGLIREDEDERLLLVLEPEAAAVHCQEREKAQLQIGTRFMVIDSGGGTVDITAYEVSEEGLKELIEGGGGAHGSVFIDKEFLKFLKERLTPEAIELFHDQDPIDFVDLLTTWERMKCSYDHRREEDVVYFNIQSKLWKMLNKTFPHVLKDLGDTQGGEDEVIHLSRETMLSLFTPTLDKLVERVREQFSKIDRGGCDVIYLVGGFSRSPLLQQRIFDEFSANIKRIVIPPEPGAAILEGTVAFGLNPSVIRARRTRLTYGCAAEMEFESNIDPPHKKVFRKDKGKSNCKDRFEIFVQAGQVIRVGDKIKRKFFPLVNSQTNLKLEFFNTPKLNPRYTDEEGVTYLGTLNVSMPDTKGGVTRLVEVTMFFGQTEIKVSARDLNTGAVYKAELRFSSTYDLMS